MRRMVKYPSINQFRQTVKEITERACFIGLDDDGKAQFDYLKPKPVVDFTISTKLHGTNAGFIYTKNETWFQSKERIIDINNDNMGCAFMMTQRLDEFNYICNEIISRYDIDIEKYGVALYMELAGKGVQKGIALSELDKNFFIFSFAKIFVLDPTADDKNYWIEIKQLF